MSFMEKKRMAALMTIDTAYSASAASDAIGSDGKSPLTIRPETVHDRASLVMGSRENVDLFASFLKHSF